MPLFQDVIARLITSATSSLASGFSFARLGEVAQAFLADAMRAAAENLANTGSEKKQFVLDAFGRFLDAVPLPWWLAIVRSPIKSILLAWADGAIEAIYERFKDAINEGAANG